MFRLTAAARALGVTSIGEDVTITRVTTDSRDVQDGDLFVAIRGARFDGHAFVSQALDKGAAAVMVSGGCNRRTFLCVPLMVSNMPSSCSRSFRDATT